MSFAAQESVYDARGETEEDTDEPECETLLLSTERSGSLTRLAAEIV